LTVRCPGCGREYDPALFAFGRTIHCACGQRVGVAPADVPLADPPRFAADAMLGKLARWLRLLGFDTVYEPDIADEALVRRALNEGRIILTRDRGLPEAWRVSAIHLVSAERPLAQVREVAGEFDLVRRARLLTRCSRCNTLLIPATREEARDRVPPRVLASAQQLHRCPGCGRFYWTGSHVKRMRRMVEDLFP
jgi:uncharacterized protein with PIN domain